MRRLDTVIASLLFAALVMQPPLTHAQASVTITGVIHDQHGRVPAKISNEFGDHIVPMFAYRLDGDSPRQLANVTNDGRYKVSVEPGVYEL